MSSNSQQDPFRVIIVGGSIAGLTLALCLERAGIDYLVLEARDRIDPQVGASIGIFSNGARILEQLGVYDKIEQNTDAPIWYEMLTGEGTLVQKGDSLLLIHSRTGYPVAFLERRQVLQILYENISNRSRIITQKKVKTVDHIENGLLVHCEDGSVFAGDVVAGADGVHSRIRRVMWQHAESKNSLVHLEKDKNAMFAEYRCLYGISSAVPELEAKTQYRTFNKNYSFLVHVGKDGICFWFVFEKLDKIYRPPNMPRYNDDSDPDEFVKRFLHCRVSQKVAFGALWERRTATKLAALEEAQYRHWAYDRMVCLGDSIHKMTPNIGQGGNWAIESAAALTNQLYALLEQTKGRPSIRDIAMALGHYENSRQARTREVCDTAGTATRLEAFAGFHHRLLSLYVVPYAGDMLVDVHCQAVAGAPMLDFIPPPERSLRDGTVFEAARLAERGDTVGWRMLRSLPLLAICFVGHVGHMSGRIDTRPSQVALMGDMAPLHIIGMVETLRRGNNFTFAALWPVFALVGQQNTTMPYALPVYFFLHYVQCSLDRYATPDNRHVPSHHARTIGPAVALGYLIPATSIMVNSTTQIFDGVWWQIYPFFIILVQRAFALFAHNTVAIDKIQNPTTDMKHLRRAYIVGGAVAGAVYICSVWTWCTPRLLLDTHRHLITLCSGFFWELLHFRDLKRGGRLKAGYLKVVAVLSCTTLLFGPGAAMAVGWAWREEMLANKSG